MEEVFRSSNLQDVIIIDREKLKDLRFTDDVALCTEDTTQRERNLNILNNESQKVGLKTRIENTKYMTNYKTDDIKVEDKVIERVTQ